MIIRRQSQRDSLPFLVECGRGVQQEINLAAYLFWPRWIKISRNLIYVAYQHCPLSCVSVFADAWCTWWWQPKQSHHKFKAIVHYCILEAAFCFRLGCQTISYRTRRSSSSRPTRYIVSKYQHFILTYGHRNLILGFQIKSFFFKAILILHCTHRKKHVLLGWYANM